MKALTKEYILEKIIRISWRTGNMYIIALLYVILGYLFTSLNHAIPISTLKKIQEKYDKSANIIIITTAMFELLLIVIETYLIRNIIKFLSKNGILFPSTWISRQVKMNRLIQNEFGGSIFIGYIIFLFSTRLNDKLAYIGGSNWKTA